MGKGDNGEGVGARFNGTTNGDDHHNMNHAWEMFPERVIDAALGPARR